MEHIVKKRLGQNSLGFHVNAQDHHLDPEEMMKRIAPEDLVRFGMIPEFIGRLPVISVLDQLQVADLEKILLRTKNAMVKQYSKLFAIDGVRLRLTSDAVRAVAQKAVELKTGARALRSIMENLMLEVMYTLPQRDDVTEVVIDSAVVAGKRRPTLRRAIKSVPTENAA
jgi:ATP-dependent Clp protease ATP-binding subunit ClpX